MMPLAAATYFLSLRYIFKSGGPIGLLFFSKENLALSGAILLRCAKMVLWGKG